MKETERAGNRGLKTSRKMLISKLFLHSVCVIYSANLFKSYRKAIRLQLFPRCGSVVHCLNAAAYRRLIKLLKKQKDDYYGIIFTSRV